MLVKARGSEKWSSNWSGHQNLPECWLNNRLLGSSLRVSGSVCLGWAEVCISNHLPKDADTPALETTF
jgi:hypothetical protein